MNILIVSAHPDPASLTHALREVATGQLQAEGHEVRFTDLYAAHWKSAVDRADFPALPATGRLRVAVISALWSLGGQGGVGQGVCRVHRRFQQRLRAARRQPRQSLSPQQH